MKQKHNNILLQISAIFFICVFCVGIIKLIRFWIAVEKQTGLTATTLIQVLSNNYSSLLSTDNQINILVLGIAGGDHEGPDLTDTIIVGSINRTKQSLSLISVPRDIWSETLKDKINSAYHYGEAKKAGGGVVLAQAIVEDVIGIPIHYAVVVNFSQFMKLVDAIGGIDVQIPIGFVDTEYPIAGKENDECNGDTTYQCRYETIQFVKGIQHMDGTTALQYVRSRHAEGDEGTDFSRGDRQQDVIFSIKEKILSMKPWFHPFLAMKLLEVVDSATETTMSFGSQLLMAKMILNMRSQSVSKISLEPLLVVPPTWMYGRYVLVPEKDFETIHEYIKQAL